MTLNTFTVGRQEQLEVTITDEMIDRFSILSTDTNPLHMKTEVARRFGFPRRVAQIVSIDGEHGWRKGAAPPRRKIVWKPAQPFETLSLPEEIRRATVAHKHALTPDFAYLQEHLDAESGVS